MANKPQAASGKKNSGPFWQRNSNNGTAASPDPVSNPNARSTTTIGKGLSIEGGTIKGDGNVCVDGYFVGDIEITGAVEIGASGAVYGDITADCATISGNSKGMVNALTKILLTSTAVVEGALTSNAIVIDEHAVFNGTCKMETDVQLPDTGKKNQDQE